jgi:hypothetical protein
MKHRSLISSQFLNVKTLALAALAAATLTSTPALAGDMDRDDDLKIELVRSPALKTFPNFVPNAHGKVKVESVGPVEIMEVKVWGLPPDTDFDFFVIQVPNGPFGMSWYQGDIETNRHGVGYGRFIGRFNIETFIVAPGTAPSPVVFHNAFPDAFQNPPTGPIHTYHLGLWFNSPSDAQKAGGPGTVTPFNGEHNAGVQVLNTSNYPDLAGPLINLKPSGN